jgi:hypothetical protein
MNDDKLDYFKRELFGVVVFLGVIFTSLSFLDNEVPAYWFAYTYLGIILGLVGGIANYGASPYKEYCYPWKNKLLAILFMLVVASWFQRWYF